MKQGAHILYDSSSANIVFPGVYICPVGKEMLITNEHLQPRLGSLTQERGSNNRGSSNGTNMSVWVYMLEPACYVI